MLLFMLAGYEICAVNNTRPRFVVYITFILNLLYVVLTYFNSYV